MIGLSGAVRTLRLHIKGTIANSVPTSRSGTERLREWKSLVASCVKDLRGARRWDPEDNFAITLGLSFCPSLHGNQRLDVENFIKPILDALAAGLFCDEETNPQDIERWDYDDSNFSILLIHRLADANREKDEGIAVWVSARPS